MVDHGLSAALALRKFLCRNSIAMDNALLAVAAPVLVSTASAAGRLASSAAVPFAAVFEAAGKLLAPQRDVESLAVQEISERASELIADLKDRIRGVIKTSGISFDGPLRVRLSAGDGRLELADPHPSRAVLEAALNADAQLVRDFSQYAVLAKLFDSDEHAELALVLSTGKNDM